MLDLQGDSIHSFKTMFEVKTSMYIYIFVDLMLKIGFVFVNEYFSVPNFVTVIIYLFHLFKSEKSPRQYRKYIQIYEHKYGIKQRLSAVEFAHAFTYVIKFPTSDMSKSAESVAYIRGHSCKSRSTSIEILPCQITLLTL
jgi:hypothetical protein